MSKIEVGEYIRTTDGEIEKVVLIYDNRYMNEDGNMTHFDDIKTHSKNIEDLIEVGDVIEYTDDDGEYIKDFIIKKLTKESLISLIEYLKAYCKIISILTHELYEQNSYKVEE